MGSWGPTWSTHTHLYRKVRLTQLRKFSETERALEPKICHENLRAKKMSAIKKQNQITRGWITWTHNGGRRNKFLKHRNDNEAKFLLKIILSQWGSCVWSSSSHLSTLVGISEKLSFACRPKDGACIAIDEDEPVLSQEESIWKDEENFANGELIDSLTQWLTNWLHKKEKKRFFKSKSWRERAHNEGVIWERGRQTERHTHGNSSRSNELFTTTIIRLAKWGLRLILTQSTDQFTLTIDGLMQSLVIISDEACSPLSLSLM